MTELAYMVRSHWGQDGIALVPQSAVIREWIGEPPVLFAVTDTRKVNHDDRGADLEAAEYIAPSKGDRVVFNIGELGRLKHEDKVIDHAVVVLHPFEERELDTIRQAVEADSIGKLFVLIWSRRDMVHTWLAGLGAVDLNTGIAAEPSDPLLLAAAEMIQNEEYNGLSSGRGKDAIVQLVRAFAAEGYAVDPEPWLRAYFAAGGSFRHAESIKKLVTEMKAGTRHRVKARYRDNIVEIMRHQLDERSSSKST